MVIDPFILFNLFTHPDNLITLNQTNFNPTKPTNQHDKTIMVFDFEDLKKQAARHRPTMSLKMLKDSKFQREVEYILREVTLYSYEMNREALYISHFYKEPRWDISIKDNHKNKRASFCKAVLQLIKDGKLNPDDIIFTDQSVAKFELKSNNQITQSMMLRPKKVRIFMAVHKKAGFIGPLYLEKVTYPEKLSMTPKEYREFLDKVVIPEFKERLEPEEFNRAWWQQDGISTDIIKSPEVILYLKTLFSDRLLSEKSGLPYALPPESPDLSLLDYFIWTFIKSTIEFKNPKEPENFVIFINRGFELLSIKYRDHLDHAYDDFLKRLTICDERRGRHFEHIIGYWKKEKGIPDTCKICEKPHKCPCEGCNRECEDYWDDDVGNQMTPFLDINDPDVIKELLEEEREALESAE